MKHIPKAFFAATTVFALLCSAKPAEASSTHFLLQVQAGLATPPLEHLDLTFGYGVMMGFGGRLSGTPLRFYVLAAYDRARFQSRVSQNGVQYDTSHAFNDFQLGIRVLIPVVWRLRWYVEVLGGGSMVHNELHEDSQPALEGNEWSGLLTGTTGLEIRWHRHLATGLRAELRYLMNASKAYDPVLQDNRAGALRATVLLTQSFMF